VYPPREQRLLEEQIPGFEKRLAIRPGLTGLAQVYNRSDDAESKLQHDLQYMKRMNMWLDCRLILLSVFNTLRHWKQVDMAITEANHKDKN